MKCTCFLFLQAVLLASTTLHPALAGSKGPLVKVDLKLGPKSIKKDLYQLAVWLETSDGAYLDTIYVTDKTARKGLGNGYTKVFGWVIREVPEALPVWAYSRNVRYGKSVYPPKEKPLPDAISGPTGKTERFSRTFSISPDIVKKSGGKSIVCLAEINVGKDGVPSVIFKGTLDLTAAGAAKLNYVGAGHKKGANDKITPDPKGRFRPNNYVAEATVSIVAK